MGVDVHRPGSFKQQNKHHKTGRHRSRSQIEKESKGKVSAKDLIGKRVKKPVNKQERRNQVVQLRKQKRSDFNEKRRGGLLNPPILTCIVSLTTGINVEKSLQLLKEADDEANSIVNDLNILHIASPKLKQRYSFLLPENGDMYANLDAAKVADRILFLVHAEGGIETFADEFLSCLFTQGLPSVLIAIQGLSELPLKKQIESKQRILKILNNRFANEKILTLNTAADGLLLLRALDIKKQKCITFRDKRAYLTSDDVTFKENVVENHIGTLSLTGYIRGQTLSANSLVHLPGQGDFQLSHIDYATDLNIMPNKRKIDVDEEMKESILLEKADPEIQCSLKSEVEIDPLAGEQTWPTEEELADAEMEEQQRNTSEKTTKRVPKGTSNYQAAWILESDDDEDNEDECNSNSENDDDEMNDVEAAISEEESDQEEYETMSIATTAVQDEQKYDNEYDPIEERKELEMLREDDAKFPDEVDTPTDMAARVRFQRYRGLRSFRTSPWDAKENLPLDYSRIFQFENFKQTRNSAFNEIKNIESGAIVGTYVTVHIKNVPSSMMLRYKDKPIVMFGLLKHEHKMSVLNMCIRRPKAEIDEEAEIIKSKESLIYHIGYRRFRSAAIFSQHTNADKHKVERYMPDAGPFVATVFAPILYAPASVLVFKERTNGEHSLIASGSLLSVNPNRIILKRIVLSGHPFKINQRTVTVRYMFFSSDDINWFKPVELRTKWGRRGHIKQSLGTHGHMKCQFDGHLKSQDTVMLNLYKRQYPKWTYDPKVDIEIMEYEKIEKMF